MATASKSAELRVSQHFCWSLNHQTSVCSRLIMTVPSNTLPSTWVRVAILLASLSTPGAKYMTGDLKDFYLNTPMKATNMCVFPLTSFPPSASLDMTYCHWFTMVSSMPSAAKACAACPKPDTSPTTNSRHSLLPKVLTLLQCPSPPPMAPRQIQPCLHLGCRRFWDQVH
jgi:hypothetical protein